MRDGVNRVVVQFRIMSSCTARSREEGPHDLDLRRPERAGQEHGHPLGVFPDGRPDSFPRFHENILGKGDRSPRPSRAARILPEAAGLYYPHGGPNSRPFPKGSCSPTNRRDWPAGSPAASVTAAVVLMVVPGRRFHRGVQIVDAAHGHGRKRRVRGAGETSGQIDLPDIVSRRVPDGPTGNLFGRSNLPPRRPGRDAGRSPGCNARRYGPRAVSYAGSVAGKCRRQDAIIPPRNHAFPSSAL